MDYYHFLNVSPEEALRVSISWTRKDGCENEPRTPTSGSDPHRLQLTAAGGRQLVVVRSDCICKLFKVTYVYMCKDILCEGCIRKLFTENKCGGFVTIFILGNKWSNCL